MRGLARSKPWPALVAAAGALLILAPAAAHAQQVTFGANLNRPANAAFDCTVLPPFGFPTGVGTCTWFGVGRFADTSEGFNTPAGNGVITRFRVKVGPVTGPMQAVVLQSLRAPGSGIAVCCKQIAQTDVFVPAPNAITTIPAQIPARNELDPLTGVFVFDTMALSVLAPGVPIPAHDTGDIDTLSGPGAAAYFPAFQPLQERADSAGVFGSQVLMQGDWVPTPTSGEQNPNALLPPNTPPPIASPLVVALTQRDAAVQNGRAVLSLLCTQVVDCSGIARLQNRAVGVTAGASAAAKTKTYARRRFEIAAGQTEEVRAKLNKKGRRLLRRGDGSARAYVNLKMGQNRISLGRVTLSR